MKHSLLQNKKGSVLVLAIILTAGILVATVEFSVYTVNSLRQSRNIDRSMLAYYAAESGAESALHQLRKRPLVTDTLVGSPTFGHVVLNPTKGSISTGGDQTNLDTTNNLDTSNNSATWNLEYPQFNDTSDVMRTTRIAKNQSLAIPLYNFEGLMPLNVHSMKVAWDSESNCDGGTVPVPAWIQAKVATWTTDGTVIGTGSTLSWGDSADKIRNIQQYLKTPLGLVKEVVFNDVTTSEIFPEKNKEQPLVVQVTPLYCDLYGVTISFYDDVGGVIPMTNMYTIAPQGNYQNVRQQLHLTLPGQEGSGLSSLFDYVLFSEKTVEKN